MCPLLDLTSGLAVVLAQVLPLVLSVSFRIPPLARQLFPLFLGLSVWFYHPTDCLLTCIDEDEDALSFVNFVVYYFWLRRGFG